jgi:hypothetical protein
VDQEKERLIETAAGGVSVAPIARTPEQESEIQSLLTHCLRRYASRYRHQFSDPDDFAIADQDYHEMVDDHPWMTPEIFAATERWLRYDRDDPGSKRFMPDVAEFVARARFERQRTAQRRSSAALLGDSSR